MPDFEDITTDEAIACTVADLKAEIGELAASQIETLCYLFITKVCEDLAGGDPNAQT